MYLCKFTYEKLTLTNVCIYRYIYMHTCLHTYIYIHLNSNANIYIFMLSMFELTGTATGDKAINFSNLPVIVFLVQELLRS